MTPARQAWYQEVHEWLTGAARSGDIGDIGAVKQVTTVKERPWSVVLRVDFQKATAYFKACGAGGSHEPGLLLHLQRGWAHSIPEMLAVDVGRGWILMADGGHPLREVFDLPGQLAVLRRLLPAYAELQSATMQSIEAFLRLGLPDRRLHRLPELLEELISGEVIAVGRSARAAAELRASVRRWLPGFEQCCADLAAAPYSAALDHGDLHPGNVLMRGEDYRFGDWGDSCVTHPFVSMGVTFEMVLSQLSAVDRDEHARQLRDAYLEPWATYGSPAFLEADFRRALWVSHAVRALDFARMFAGGDEESRARWQPLVARPLEQWAREGPGGP
jgi:hypothetical protein